MDQETPKPTPIEVPLERLAPEVLEGIVDEFILREGTDYGREEVPLTTKRQQVLRQIQRGDVKVYFDPESESVTLRPSEAGPLQG